MFKYLYQIALIIVSVGFASVSMAQAQNPPQTMLKNGQPDSKIPRCLEDYRNLNKRPTRTFVEVGTTIFDAGLARYTQSWVDQIQTTLERNPTLVSKYPDINSELKIVVEIFPRGQIGALEIDKSSGFRNLDAETIAIIKNSAPFASFPQDVCMKIDILHLVSTIQFTGGGARVKRAQ